jgi:flagellar hook-associated protein 2
MVTRITGLSSGMDIDSLVKSLMKAEKLPEDKMVQKKQTLSWKMDSYREVNTKLSAFRDSLSAMRYSSDWGQTKVAPSDATKVTVTSDSTATDSVHTIDIISLASGANAYSSAGVSSESLMGNTDLSVGTTNITSSNNSFNVTLNGVTKKVTLADGDYDFAGIQSQVQASLDQSFGANQITASASGNYLALTPNGTAGNLPQITVGLINGNNGLSDLGFVDQQSYKLNIADQLGNTATQFATPLTYGDFKVNGQDITYSDTDTMASIMAKVNNSVAGVNMTYDSISDKFSFTSKNTGLAAKIQLEDGISGNFLTAINVDIHDPLYVEATGKDAKVKLDGVTSSRASNSFTSNGITYNLIAPTTTSITVTSTKDVDAMVDKIKTFVSQYNDMIGLIGTKLNETKDNNFLPLTTDQRAAMTDTQIATWETKAKVGLLRKDDILSNISTSFRSYLSSQVQSISTTYNRLISIGITTNPYNSTSPSDAGKIKLDESKLRTAIAQDPNGVISLFTNQDTSFVDSNGVPQPTTPTNKQGIAQVMFNTVNLNLTRLLHRAGNTGALANDASTDLGRQLISITRLISDFDSKLSKKEAAYYAKFSLMDKAIQKSNEQSAALSNFASSSSG